MSLWLDGGRSATEVTANVAPGSAACACADRPASWTDPLVVRPNFEDKRGLDTVWEQAAIRPRGVRAGRLPERC
jgi:hypothetical protein